MTLRAVLAGHGMAELVDTAELLACELVTNAYRYSAGHATLRLRLVEGGRLRGGVWDTNPVIPAPFDQPPGVRAPLCAPALDSRTADGGRGLLLVQSCADNWGGYPLGDDLFGWRGKLLWFVAMTEPGAVDAVSVRALACGNHAWQPAACCSAA